jgi:hypothetical protein
MSLPLRLAIMLTPLLVWAALYLLSRFAGISPTRFAPWLRAGFILLMGVYVTLFAFGHTGLSDIFAIHAWGLLVANLWIKRRYRQEMAESVLTSLKL